MNWSFAVHMKTIKLTLCVLFIFSIGIFSYGQEDSHDLPPFEMLPQKPGEIKEIYYLPHKTIYQIYDFKGKLLKDSIGKYIDMTLLEKGKYFIDYDGLREVYEKTSEVPKELTPPKKCK